MKMSQKARVQSPHLLLKRDRKVDQALKVKAVKISIGQMIVMTLSLSSIRLKQLDGNKSIEYHLNDFDLMNAL